MNSPNYANWNLTARNLLLGKTVKDVRYMTRKDADKIGVEYWNSMPIIIQFTDNTMITIASDDECNDGGAVLVLNDPKPDSDITLLPTLY